MTAYPDTQIAFVFTVFMAPKAYMSTGGDGGGVVVGLKATPPPSKISKETPLKFFRAILAKNLGKIAKF